MRLSRKEIVLLITIVSLHLNVARVNGDDEELSEEAAMLRDIIVKLRHQLLALESDLSLLCRQGTPAEARPEPGQTA